MTTIITLLPGDQVYPTGFNNLNSNFAALNSGKLETSGTAATATSLQNARTIAGVSFNGTANIAIASTGLSDTLSIVLLASTQTLTNKTTIGLKADGFVDTNGNKVVEIDAITSSTGVNFLIQKAAATGQAVLLQASGSDTDVYLNMVTQGAGTVRANGVNVATISDTQTLTNKRTTKRVLSAASYTTNTGSSLNGDTTDMFIVTAQTGALKFNNPSGTPTDGQTLIISVASSTTSARALTWDTAFGSTTVTLPSTTAATTATLTIGFIWSVSKSLWQCVASA